MEASLRALTIVDIPLINEFLIKMNMPTNPEQITFLINGNPGLSQAVFQDEKMIGMVLCSFDGLRGYLNKLVVAEDFRQAGWGQKLISAAKVALKKQNCPELVIACMPFLAKWYEKQGFVKTERLFYTLDLANSEQVSESCG